MSDNQVDDPIRMTVKVSRVKDPELAADLAPLGKYQNAKRLIALARIGLMVTKGQSPPVEKLPIAVAPVPTRVTPAPALSAASPAAPSPASDQSPYLPDLSDVFDFGVQH